MKEDNGFGPSMMFGIPGPGPKRDTKGIPSDKKKEKGIQVKDMKRNIPTFEEFILMENSTGERVCLFPGRFQP